MKFRFTSGINCFSGIKFEDGWNNDIVTIKGGTGSGKTSFAYNIAKANADLGFKVLYLTEFESPKDVKSIVFSTLPYTDSGFNFCSWLSKQDIFDLIIIDDFLSYPLGKTLLQQICALTDNKSFVFVCNYREAIKIDGLRTSGMSVSQPILEPKSLGYMSSKIYRINSNAETYTISIEKNRYGMQYDFFIDKDCLPHPYFKKSHKLNFAFCDSIGELIND